MVLYICLQQQYQMIFDQEDQVKRTHSQLEKYKAETPTTSDSLAVDTISAELAQQRMQEQETVHILDKEEKTLFRILEKNFQQSGEDDALQKELRMTRQLSKNAVWQEIQECEFKIVVEVIANDEECIKTFKKSVIKAIQTQDQMTLIFDRQHQKIKLQEEQVYRYNIYIQDSDFFSRKISAKSLKIPKNAKKWSVLKVPFSQQQQYNPISLNVQLQKIGKFSLKPLSIKFPSTTIQQFLDYKFKLLNKSQILNEVQSISELKGILHPLSKQNMGSRIIQKLLSKINVQINADEKSQNFNKKKYLQFEDVIMELKPRFCQMVLDRYGNYVFQKIFKMGVAKHKQLCLDTLKQKIMEILMTKEGTHSIQTVIDALEDEQIEKQFSQFTQQNIIELCTNQFSTHLVQKLIPKLAILPSKLLQNFSVLSSDKYGAIVLKCLLIGCNNQKWPFLVSYRSQFLTACYNSISTLPFCQYGHYLLQQLLNFYTYQQLYGIVCYIANYIKYFGQSRYSSSIVRKFIQFYGDLVTLPVVYSILGQMNANEYQQRQKGQQGQQVGCLAQLMESSTGQFLLHRILQYIQDAGTRSWLQNEMIKISTKINSYQKRYKWMKFFKLQ